ncbi:D,D-heptose 1,7-bisphosphate phosphatase, partial [Campylobacter coli]|nr:D,D-heptose 1,7-bisphosphate phosphatase [Campylobacter coli]EAL1837761.1 D,D-heptose 1,7-bisphosphate phosphatase [Campylobacter coli]EAM0301486.1 D,D-heptose 1,7-bisphosphate phosphatase [Campylobacter coli]
MFIFFNLNYIIIYSMKRKAL